MPTELSNFSAISWWEQVTFQWYDYGVCIVLDQHAQLDCYSASSLKQQSGIDILLHSYTLSWFWTNQLLLLLLNAAYLVEKHQIPISPDLVWPDWGSNPWSTALEASMLTITPLMCLIQDWVRNYHENLNTNLHIKYINIKYFWKSIYIVMYQHNRISSTTNIKYKLHWFTLCIWQL